MSVTGVVGGQTVALSDAASLIGSLTMNGKTAYESDVFITDVAGTCAALQDNANPANGAVLAIGVAGPAPVAAGMYAVSAGGSARVAYAAQDANCVQTVNVNAVSGTVTYVTVNSSTLAGSFDVTFASGDHLTGSFSAPTCNASLNTVVNQGASMPPCMHDG